MAYQLPELEYAYDALEPHIDARTMEIHHTKHHNTYITNLNNALEGAGVEAPTCISDLISKIGDLPEGIRTAVRNNGGGHANHSLFWTLLSPSGGGEPTGVLRGIQEGFCQSRGHTVRLRLGMALRQVRRQPFRLQHGQPGQPGNG